MVMHVKKLIFGISTVAAIVGKHEAEAVPVVAIFSIYMMCLTFGTYLFCFRTKMHIMSSLKHLDFLRYGYIWADGITVKKPMEVSAPKYVEYLMDWIEAQLDDESIFPQKLGLPFPHNFLDVVKTILKRLFHVYAHIYHSHFQTIVNLKEEAHLNTCFKHFILFTWEFKLIDRGELAPLQEIVKSIL